MNILLPLPEIYNLLKGSIPKNIEELTIPLAILENLEELSNYPNVRKLTIDDYSFLTIKELEIIHQTTNIKEIRTRTFEPLYNKEKKNKNFVIIDAPIKLSKYKDITIISNKNKLYKNITLEAYINDIEDLDVLGELYNKSEISVEELKTIRIYKKEELEANRKKPFLAITMTKDHKIEKLKVTAPDIKTAKKVLDKFTSKYQMSSVELVLENKTYEDLNELEKYKDQTELIINYGDLYPTSYENFLSMRATIDWYKELITQTNLSPLEKTMYAYDIIKSFQYNEHPEDTKNSRYIPEIIESGSIVCVGYSNFLKEVLTELDIPCVACSVTCQDDLGNQIGHQRNIVRIDDDKYNIHGVYVLDATWDNKKKELSVVEDEAGNKQVRYQKKSTDKTLKEYDGLSLYRNFLVPYKDYKKAYPSDSVPALFKMVEQEEVKEKLFSSIITNSKTTPTYSIADEQMNQLFPKNESKESIKNFIRTTNKPTLDTFQTVLQTVRQQEGYGETYLKTSINSTVELNQMIEELNQSEKTFFTNETSHQRK